MNKFIWFLTTVAIIHLTYLILIKRKKEMSTKKCLRCGRITDKNDTCKCQLSFSNYYSSNNSSNNYSSNDYSGSYSDSYSNSSYDDSSSSSSDCSSSSDSSSGCD